MVGRLEVRTDDSIASHMRFYAEGEVEREEADDGHH